MTHATEMYHHNTRSTKGRERRERPEEAPLAQALEQCIRVSEWVRDLCADGDIESQPGPRYITKNVNSIQGDSKLYHTLKSIRRESDRHPITAIFLQDHRLGRDREKDIASTAKAQSLLTITAHPLKHRDGKHYGGTMVIIPYESVELEKGETIHDACTRIASTRQAACKARIVSATMKVDGKKRKLVSCYAPAKAVSTDVNSKRSTFFTNVLKKFITQDSIIGMDANCVPDIRLDIKKTTPSPYDNEGAQELADLVDEKGLADITRACIPTEPFYTAQHKVQGGECWSRIDHIYAPADGDTHWAHAACVDFFPKREHAIEIDHMAVEVRSKRVKVERGKDLETINENVFDDPTFTSTLLERMTTLKNQTDTSGPRGWRDMWEAMKTEVKKLSLAHTAKLKYKQSAHVQTRKTQLAHIQKLKQLGTAGSDDIAKEATLTKEISELSKQEYTLHQTLEKEAYNIGKTHDRCTAEFFRPWKPTHAAQHIESMKEADWTDPSNPQFTGRTVKGHKEVLTELTKYYTALFAKKVISMIAKMACLATLSDPKSRRVLPPTAAKCGAPITAEELTSILNTLPTKKSPGPDRIPNKFYKTYSVFLADILAEVFNESHTHGELPATCTQGIISVLYKKKDREDPRNYRPITLLNNDYKILTRVLTRRMNEAVVQFVSPQQNGFVPGEFLPENIMLLKLIQAYIEEEDSNAYFIFLDMENAFDRSSWEYLVEVLEAIGFDKDFIGYVKLFYSHDNPPTRQIAMSGHLGQSFPLNSGVAQGSPSTQE